MKLDNGKIVDINTAEGWAEYVRVGHSKNLVEMGIEPTEENLQKYQDEIAETVLGIQADLEKRDQQVNDMIRILGHTYLGFVKGPDAYGVKKVYDRWNEKFPYDIALMMVFKMGQIYGIRNERKRIARRS